VNNLANILKEYYNLEVIDIKPAPRGFCAETYFIHTSSDKYFIKIYNNPKFTGNVEESLPVLYELNKLGISNITCPIKTNQGEFLVRIEGKLYVLFNCIEGIATMNFNVEDYLDLLTDIYLLTPKLKSMEVSRETFSTAAAKAYERYSNYFYSYNGEGTIELLTKDMLLCRKQELDAHLQTYLQTSKNCQNIESMYYLTHSDGSGNVMVNGSELYIVDWDGLMLAPIERDLWFYVDDSARLSAFKVMLASKGTKYSFNKEYFKYYIYNRFFEDLEGYLAEIAEASDEMKQKWMYEETHKTCFVWIYGLMDALKYL
jgi:spectinomycin phosphotransferase